MNLEFKFTFEERETEIIICENTNDLVRLTERIQELGGETWITNCEVIDHEGVR